MRILVYILTFFSFLLGGAHFMRAGNYGLMVTALLLPLLFYIRKRWVLYIIGGSLALLAVEWVATALNIYEIRQKFNMPATRMLIIMGSVAFFTLISAATLFSKKMLRRYPRQRSDIPVTASFFLAAVLVAFPMVKVDLQVLLAQRFFPGFEWLQVAGLSFYSAFITEKMLDRSQQPKWRKYIWTIFSVVFFGQLILGLSGFETFLMTGKLHLPIPAIIMAGPLYRWESSFMIFLFLGSIVLVGPAWCSHLCYFGVWDFHASKAMKRPKNLPKYRQIYRLGILVLIGGVALSMNMLGVPPVTATIAGFIVGLVGVGVLMYWSRKTGVMTHCTVYCPIGLWAVILGKINPFRVKIDNRCDECMKCTMNCRYDALRKEDVLNRKPNLNCTLCGDCIEACDVKGSSINYRLIKLKPETARKVFIVMVVAIHTSFLAMGRI